MKFENLKIGTQLKLGFFAMLFFVIVLGLTSFWQSAQIHEQTETIYQHPMQVRRAVSKLETDLLNMQIATRDLLLAVDDSKKHSAIERMEIAADDALNQFRIIKERFLGNPADVDEAYRLFVAWRTARAENTKLALEGKLDSAKEDLLVTGVTGMYREKLMAKINEIDTFAKNKSDNLYNQSIEITRSLNVQLFFLIAIILLLSILINYILLRNIRKPLHELTNTTNRFHNGDQSARSTIQSENELGLLAASFNSLADSIQENFSDDEKIANLSRVIVAEDDAKKFFYSVLGELSAHTETQMSAVYLLSADKSAYEQFVLIGTCESAKQSFSADLFEGEFGLALSSRKMQHIKNIPETTRFVFQTVQGNVIPSEIITIPVLAGNEVVAVISLASIKPYSRQALKIIDALQVALGARVTSILAYRKMKSLTETLKEQNSELEIQKTELETQSSELAQQNVALELHKQQLDEANRQKTIFLSNMSHELRTPLNSVIALSGVLNRRLAGTIPDEEHSYLEVIERNGKNLLALINDILDISRIESGRIELDLNVFNGNNLVSEIISMILPQAHQKGIALLHAATVTDIEIHSDPDKCRHILQNLIANAVKFTEAGKVEITTSRVDENFVVSVADTGIGIAEEHLPHIFEEFRQADGSTSRKFGGTGLGLAIAKKYAMLLGGSISAKSTKGAGSEFTLTLPLNCVPGSKNIGVVQKTEIKPALTSQPLVDRNLAAAKTILLVEDSEPAIIQIMDILEESGYKVLVAHDGAEALEIIGQTIPDAMILDLMMPGIDGFAVLSTIREEERTAHIPVLILTAKHISKDELKFLKRNNVYQLIQKGDVNRSELLNTVTAMVFPAHTEPAAPRNRSIIEGRPLILIVEDNPDNMKTAKALLGDKFELLEATDGNAAIQMAKEHHPNLVLMDIALPVIDGVKAFKAIRMLPHLAHVPVVVLTASAMTEDRETILAHGFDAFIAKPIEEDILFKTINALLYGE